MKTTIDYRVLGMRVEATGLPTYPAQRYVVSQFDADSLTAAGANDGIADAAPAGAADNKKSRPSLFRGGRPKKHKQAALAMVPHLPDLRYDSVQKKWLQYINGCWVDTITVQMLVLGCNQVGDHLPHSRNALGSIPATFVAVPQ